MILWTDYGEIFWRIKKRSTTKYGNPYLKAAFLAEMVGDGAEAPPVADSARRRK